MSRIQPISAPGDTPGRCSVPSCGAFTRACSCPGFAFRTLWLVAVRGDEGIETLDPTGRALVVDKPEPSWLPDERGMYWLPGPEILPPGSPICAAHRQIWNQELGVVCPAHKCRASEWDRSHLAERRGGPAWWQREEAL